MTLAGASDYRVFTTRFDREISAERLDTALGPLSAADREGLDLEWSRFKAELAETDGRRSGAASRLQAVPDGVDLGRTVVTLLLDQSGSMRGRPMSLAAAAIVRAVRGLTDLGCRVEVLGFTTASWRGGRPRKRWKWLFRPKNPGRLCELLHIVYRDGDDAPGELPESTIRAMLRPDLPKENIDGEAVLWAVGRLLARPEDRKILIVLSDGSPVDDSTQQANGPYFLDAHLTESVSRIVRDGRIELAALGIGHDVSGWYPKTSTIASADDLGAGLIDFLEVLLGARSDSAR